MGDEVGQLERQRVLGWMRLARVPGVGPVLVKRVVFELGSVDAVLGAHATRLAAVEGVGPKRAEAFARTLGNGHGVAEVQAEWEQAAQAGVRIICADDAEWPAGLKGIGDPPVVLYVRGRLVERDVVAVAIVGSRECTLYGREQAERFGAGLAEAGITVVSGGARGIDTGAHQGALRVRGRTVVIQGCGLGHVYPPENRGLFERISQDAGDGGNGAVISELAMDMGPTKENFPPRNRIIAGMSLGVLVIEANQRSGSLITARLAADDYGREVFALPGRVDSPSSAGTHHLIKMGSAHLVENVGDVLEALGDVGRALLQQSAEANDAEAVPVAVGGERTVVAKRSGVDAEAGLFAQPTPAKKTPTDMPLTGAQQKILAALDSGSGPNGSGVDEICEHSGLPAGVVMAELTMLQIRALVTRVGGNRYIKSQP